MEFSRQECRSGLSFPSPGDVPNPGIKRGSPTLQAESLPSEPTESPNHCPNNNPVTSSSLWLTGHCTSVIQLAHRQQSVASLYPTDKLTQHFTKMDNWKRELAPKEYIRGEKKLIMLKLNLNQVFVEFYRRKSWSWTANTAAVPETSNMQPEEPSESCWMTWMSSVVADKGWQCPRGSKHLVIEGTHRYFTTSKAPKLKCGKLIQT